MSAQQKLPKRVRIDYAFVDVKTGREALRKFFEREEYIVDPSGRGGRTVTRHNQIKIPITLSGFLTCVASNDDGVSREFTMQVVSSTLAHGRAKRGKLLAGPPTR